MCVCVCVGGGGGGGGGGEDGMPSSKGKKKSLCAAQCVLVNTFNHTLYKVGQYTCI